MEIDILCFIFYFLKIQPEIFFNFFILDSPREFKTAFCVFEHLPAQDEFVIPLVGISEFGKCRISEKFDISENMLTCFLADSSVRRLMAIYLCTALYLCLLSLKNKVYK